MKATVLYEGSHRGYDYIIKKPEGDDHDHDGGEDGPLVLEVFGEEYELIPDSWGPAVETSYRHPSDPYSASTDPSDVAELVIKWREESSSGDG
jgi:hypothetical protein